MEASLVAKGDVMEGKIFKVGYSKSVQSKKLPFWKIKHRNVKVSKTKIAVSRSSNKELTKFECPLPWCTIRDGLKRNHIEIVVAKVPPEVAGKMSNAGFRLVLKCQSEDEKVELVKTLKPAFEAAFVDFVVNDAE